jgi:hypothetical protein
VKDGLFLMAVYLAASIVIFFLAWLFFRNVFKAAFFSFGLMSFHFFFGAAQDVLKRLLDNSFFTRYSFLVPFFFIALIVFVISLKRRKRPLINFCLYLNSLLLILLLIDISWLLEKNFIKEDQAISVNKYNISAICDTCTKPDIYFLLFDEYASSTAIKEVWNYNNNDLDSFLLQRGFRIQPYSKSNYNFTPFSMASILNMDYLYTINSKACTVKDYTEVTKQIKKNRVCSFLQSLGFTIINYSIFDLDENPAIVNESFLPLKTKLITSQTFLSRVQKDLLHLLLVGKFEMKWLSKDLIYVTDNNNNKLIKATLDESTSSSEKPRFIYSHIEMPHPPFYFNKNGKQTDKKVLITENETVPVKSYLEYLPYTNAVIKNLVTSILDNAKRPIVIILMGDHGFRTRQQPEPYYFRNQNAVYISSGNYKGFYDNISNVNEFRVLFNNLFHTSFSLLKDSTSFLIDK